MSNPVRRQHAGIAATLATFLVAGFHPVDAHAQADGSLYGVADFSYGRFQPSGLPPTHRFNSNSLSASFIGATGKYGLEGGYAPGITLETFVRFQDLKTGRRDNDPRLSRNAFAFLESPLGLWRAGRIQTNLFDIASRFNAFGNSVPFSPAVRHLFGAGGIGGVQGDFYWDTALAYTSPNLDGTTVNLMHARGRGDDRGRYTGGTVVTSLGLLGLSIGAQSVSINRGFGDPVREGTLLTGATYNFGWARAFAQYAHTSDQGQDVKSDIYAAGLQAPTGPGNLLFQLATTAARGPAIKRRQTSTSVGYSYPYDSQTDVYGLLMDDRARNQTVGESVAVGLRVKF